MEVGKAMLIVIIVFGLSFVVSTAFFLNHYNNCPAPRTIISQHGSQVTENIIETTCG
jgi:hypothetical protein